MPFSESKDNVQQPTFSLDWGVDSDWGDPDNDDFEDDDLKDDLDSKLSDLSLNEDPNGNIAMDASGAAASNCNDAVAHVESDQIQEIIIETPDEDLVANNTMIPELFSKANNAEKRTGMTCCNLLSLKLCQFHDFFFRIFQIILHSS